MTIGPEPMIRMRVRSVRFGIGRLALLLAEPVHDRRLGGRLLAAVEDVVDAAAADPDDLAVPPELLTEDAHPPVDALANGVRLERRVALGGERGPLGLLARSLRLPIRDQVLGHDQVQPPLRVISSVKRWKRSFASCGPGDASGWYCTENAGHSRWRSPSHVPSLRLTCVGSQPWRATDSGSTANPWFWAVISTLSVTRSFTGWFAPCWPNLSLYVRPPPANPMIS